MLRVPVIAAIIGFSAAALMALPEGASAATKGKKVTLAQAWSECLQYIDTNYPRGSGENDRQRTAQGLACLQRHGYRP